jgi:beta-alanine degradation protein BauB
LTHSWKLVTIVGSTVAAFAAGFALAATRPHLALDSQKVLIDNARVRVLEYRSRPAGNVCGAGEHAHPAHVTIVLSPARDRAEAVGGKTEIGDMKVGDVYWSDGETHTDVNIGKTNSRVILVELK